MNNQRVVLDSNIVIDHFKDQTLYSSKLLASTYCVPRIVVGELYAGAFAARALSITSAKSTNF